jgi:hypothetical protein
MGNLTLDEVSLGQMSEFINIVLKEAKLEVKYVQS